jgi:guanylate kinase
MKKGKICILEIDLTAAQKINAMNPDYHYLFLNVPTIDILRERMVKRGTENP